MKCFTSLLLTLFVFGCASLAPTPILMGNLVTENNKVVALYKDCSEGANYVPEKEGCNPKALEQQVLKTMDLAKTFISADIKQPQGYDVYLETVMIYFRIAERNGNEYSEAEKIARQFFEVQKATSGQSINIARYHWAVRAAAYASWQFYHDPSALTPERKEELLLCKEEGSIAFVKLEEDPIRQIRLFQALANIQNVIDLVE